MIHKNNTSVVNVLIDELTYKWLQKCVGCYHRYKAHRRIAAEMYYQLTEVTVVLHSGRWHLLMWQQWASQNFKWFTNNL